LWHLEAALPAEARARKSNPHRCPECDAAFEVSYFDDRTGERAELPMTTAEAACPACGHARSLSLPAGAERTLQVELSEGAEADEGGGG
jgi:DNA-directed RNA polymerase subunit RPC12/RpoP